MNTYSIPVFLTKHKTLFDSDTRVYYFKGRVTDEVMQKVIMWMNSCNLPIAIDGIPKCNSRDVIIELCDVCTDEQIKPVIDIVRNVMKSIDFGVWNDIIRSTSSITGINIEKHIAVNQVDDINKLISYLALNLAFDKDAIMDPYVGPNMIFNNSQLIFLSLIYWYLIDNVEFEFEGMSDLEKEVISNTELLKNHAFAMMITNILTFRINTNWIEFPRHEHVVFIRNKLSECKGYVTLMKTKQLTPAIRDNIEEFIDSNFLAKYDLKPYIFYDYLSKKQRAMIIIKSYFDSLGVKSIPSEEIFEALTQTVQHMKEYSVYPIDFLTNLSKTSVLELITELMIKNEGEVLPGVGELTQNLLKHSHDQTMGE